MGFRQGISTTWVSRTEAIPSFAAGSRFVEILLQPGTVRTAFLNDLRTKHENLVKKSEKYFAGNSELAFIW